LDFLYNNCLIKDPSLRSNIKVLLDHNLFKNVDDFNYIKEHMLDDLPTKIEVKEEHETNDDDDNFSKTNVPETPHTSPMIIHTPQLMEKSEKNEKTGEKSIDKSGSEKNNGSSGSSEKNTEKTEKPIVPPLNFSQIQEKKI